jgi:hypothetical protein
MPNYTPNYNLKKPLQDEFYNIDDHNGNMDIIDETLKILSEASGVVISPDEPETGDVWIDTDDETSSGGAVSSVNGKVGDVVLNPSDISAAPAEHNHDASDVNSGTFATDRIPTLPASKISAGTFDGAVVAPTGADYATQRIRNAAASMTDLTAGTSPLENGNMYLVYE